jgi:hypothetical protein
MRRLLLSTDRQDEDYSPYWAKSDNNTTSYLYDWLQWEVWADGVVEIRRGGARKWGCAN